MKISVVVPTYKRLNDLKRCLSALDEQASLPHEVIVVVKSSDSETQSYVMDWTVEQSLYPRKFCTVSVSGVVHGMIQGLEAASGDIVAYTDDDSAPDPMWLFSMGRHYQNPTVGGVGGRDILCNHPVVPLHGKVGKVTWYGKLIGNHHLGEGPAREVDVLKGANMSFRKQLIEFSPFLRGNNGGPENHNEVGLCLRIKRLGYSLIYDPTIKVNHYAAPRIDTEQRTQFNAESVRNSAFNMQMSLLTWLPWHQKLFRLVYSTLIGDKGYPGLVRFMIGAVRREVRVVHSYRPAQAGFLIAMMHYCGWLARGGNKLPKHSLETRTQPKVTTEDV